MLSCEKYDENLARGICISQRQNYEVDIAFRHPRFRKFSDLLPNQRSDAGPHRVHKFEPSSTTTALTSEDCD